MLELLQRIQQNIASQNYNTETSVIDGIIKPLLDSLGWDIFDVVNTVMSEYSIDNGRVDVALCHNKTPVVFIEAKKIGSINEKAEKQLLNYTFHAGVPMAILTDGKEWHFYLPILPGPSSQRRFYKLDLTERKVQDSQDILRRYLQFQAVIGGEAKQNAEQDHKDNKKSQEIINQLPKAWQKLIDEKDELLIELLSDKVSDLCGHKTSNEQAIQFLNSLIIPNQSIPNKSKSVSRSSNTQRQTTLDRSSNTQRPTVSNQINSKNNQVGFEYQGQFYSVRNNTDIMLKALQTVFKDFLTDIRDANSRALNTPKRKFVASDIRDLYKQKDEYGVLKPRSSEFIEGRYKEIYDGWYMGTNYSTNEYQKKLNAIVQITGIRLSPNWRRKK